MHSMLRNGLFCFLLLSGALAGPLMNPQPSCMGEPEEAPPEVMNVATSIQAQTSIQTMVPKITTSGVPEMPTSNPPASNACDSIRSLQSVSLSQNPSTVATVPFSVATECLNSIPLDKELSLQHVEEVKKYARFHSNLDLLKNLPEGTSKEQYPSPVDIIGAMDDLASAVSNGDVAGHHAFEAALSSAFLLARDGHLNIAGMSTGAVSFGAPFDIVSLSEDGKQVPKIFMTDKLGKGNISTDAITHIDGVGVVDFLQNVMEQVPLQGVDARYNLAFQSGAVLAPMNGFFFNRFAGTAIPESGSFNVTLESGNTTTFEFEARIPKVFPVSSGDDFLQALKNPNFTSRASPRASGSTSSSEFSASPRFTFDFKGPEVFHHRNLIKNNRGLMKRDSVEPFVVDASKTFAGFLLPNSNTAVARIPTFNIPAGPTRLTAIQNATNAYAEFMNACRKANTTNLIIDVRGNGGGVINLAYDFTVRLFPDNLNPFQAQRARADDGALIIAESLKDLTEDVLLKLNSTIETDANSKRLINDLVAAAGSNLHFRAGKLSNITTQEGFPTLDSFVGPFDVNGGNFTAAWAWNWSEPDLGQNIRSSDLKFPPDAQSQPFKESNIVLLTDGNCQSSCTILAEFLRQRGNIRTITIGGLPRLQPAAVMGGTRGSQVLTFNTLKSISTSVNDAFPPCDDVEKQRREAALPGELPFMVDPAKSSVNYLRSFREGEDTTPLQFKQDDADCKMFYTRDTVFGNLSLYQKITSMAFASNGTDGCAVGSLRQGLKRT